MEALHIMRHTRLILGGIFILLRLCVLLRLRLLRSHPVASMRLHPLQAHPVVSISTISQNKMPRKRGTSHKGSTGRGGSRRKATIGDTDGFVEQISMPIRFLINDWESKAVSDHLASGKSSGHINHYWMMKNMLGRLLEDMTVKWNGARGVAQGLLTSILQANMQLKTLEMNFNLREYSVFPNTGNEENTGAKNQGEKGGMSSAATNSPGPFQEQEDLAKNTTSVKRGRESIMEAIIFALI